MIIFFSVLQTAFSTLYLVVGLPGPHEGASFPTVVTSFAFSVGTSAAIVAASFSVPIYYTVQLAVSTFIVCGGWVTVCGGTAFFKWIGSLTRLYNRVAREAFCGPRQETVRTKWSS